MSLQPLAPRALAKYGRRYGQTFVHGSAHHNHSLVLIDAQGDVWMTDPQRTTLERADFDTTTSRRIKDQRAAVES